MNVNSEVKRSAQHDILNVEETFLLFAGLAAAGEHIPEAESLVSSACDNGVALRTHGQVEDPVGVARQCADLLHLGVLPDVYLVLRVPMGAHYLVQGLGEHEIAHLRSCIHCLDGCASQRVSEPDGPIGCAST